MSKIVVKVPLSLQILLHSILYFLLTYFTFYFVYFRGWRGRHFGTNHLHGFLVIDKDYVYTPLSNLGGNCMSFTLYCDRISIQSVACNRAIFLANFRLLGCRCYPGAECRKLSPI